MSEQSTNGSDSLLYQTMERVAELERDQEIMHGFVRDYVSSVLPLHNEKWSKKLGLIVGDSISKKGIPVLISYAENLEKELAATKR